MMKLIKLEEECMMPSTHFYACLWWLPKYETINEEDMTMTVSAEQLLTKGFLATNN